MKFLKSDEVRHYNGKEDEVRKTSPLEKKVKKKSVKKSPIACFYG